MSDYSYTSDFGAKDSLLTGDPDKVYLGADNDTEFGAVATAVATKYQNTDLAASPVGTENDVLVTPADVRSWQRSVSVPAARNLTVSTGLTGTSGLAVDASVALDTASDRNSDHSAITVTSGTLLSGGGTLEATRTIDLGYTAQAEQSVYNPNDMVIWQTGAFVRETTIGRMVNGSKMEFIGGQAASSGTLTGGASSPGASNTVDWTTTGTVHVDTTPGADVFSTSFIRRRAGMGTPTISVYAKMEGKDAADAYQRYLLQVRSSVSGSDIMASAEVEATDTEYVSAVISSAKLHDTYSYGGSGLPEGAACRVFLYNHNDSARSRSLNDVWVNIEFHGNYGVNEA